MTQANDEQRPGQRGRPRSAAADRAIIEATVRLLAEPGFSETSIEAVAAEAGVGKTTIYRRYPGKVKLVVDVLAYYLDIEPASDTGSLKVDLVEMLNEDTLRFFRGPGASLIGTLLAGRERNPQLLEIWRAKVVAPRMRQYQEVLTRAEERG